MTFHHLACISILIAGAYPLPAQSPCTVSSSRAVFTIHHVSGDPTLSLDSASKLWTSAARQRMVQDCSRQIAYPQLTTQIHGFWTDRALYLLFRCPYQVLNLFLPPDPSKDRVGLWDRDVVEMFLGDDWQNIRHYREFEIAPTADRIDLAIDLDKDKSDHAWNSGWQTLARIDRANHVWYAAAKIPLSAVTTLPVSAGTKWRANLYRIDGLGADPVRHFLCWQPTCVQNRDPNHVPEHFGTIVFAR